MKNYLLSLIISFLSLGAHALELKVGDVLLQPLHCYNCSLIEQQEKTIYSHIGVVIQTTPEVMVAEAFMKVRKVTLAEFNQKTEKKQALRVLRFRHEGLVEDMQREQEELRMIFAQDFEGLYYDAVFRWNNFDDEGREMMYCSELVSKLFQAFKGLDMPIKRMTFDVNREAWVKFFKGNVPDNEWGNSPGDYERSSLFYVVGDL